MKKKVLFIMETLGGGGAEKVLIETLKRLDFSKYAITLLLLRREGVYLSQVPKNVTVKFLLPTEPSGWFQRKILFSIKKRWWNFVVNTKCLASFIFSERYDVGVAFLEGNSSLLLSHLNAIVRKIAWVHIDLICHQILPRKVERKVYKEMDEIVCVSKGAQDALLNLYPEVKSYTHVVYNPVDIDGIMQKSHEPITSEGKIKVIAIGRLCNAQKGFDILLSAHKINIDAGANYHLTILGEGDDRAGLELFIKNNNIGSSTSLLGFKENPYPFLAASDLFVMSSYYEGYPVVLVEAMALGKAIVSTDCTGPNEALDGGKYGVLVPVGDEHALALAIRQMVENKKMLSTYSSLSKERAKIFNLRESMRQIEQLLDGESKHSSHCVICSGIFGGGRTG
ncbi:glycosyltransferase [Aeromonas sp. FDAARGOS 1405]|uniref:glycosyltransferase n=1 Tax=Aeromonas TaxID=642 RepID=UPI001C240D7E|nr:glycosyltransferase [Aeromonas sp. FDAARGOS 1405]QXB30653.1 glycosyltransferase [Aeromonas sp. FDAARGOS 1405]